MGDLVIPENYEEMNIWEYGKFLYEFVKTDLGKAILEKDSFQHAYLMAWLDAFSAKIEVLQAGIVVVQEAEKTITTGLDIIYAGAELSDASIKTMIEKIENDILSGTVAALTIAVDVVEVSDEMVNAIKAEVAILRLNVATAKAEVEAERAKLEEVQISVPGGEALVAAEERLAEVTANYNALADKLVKLEASLVEAEEYRAEAQAQYDALVELENTPVEPEIPTEPEVPAESEQPTTTTPVIYYAPAPVVEEVVEAEVEEVVENVVTNNEITIQDEVVEIVDEETPLADGVTEIVEEEVPLAANKEENEVAPVVTAIAGTATVAAAGGVGFVFFRKRKFF